MINLFKHGTTRAKILMRLNAATGCVSLAVGFLTLVAWSVRADKFIVLTSSSSPLHFNSALIFVFFGLAFVGRGLEMRPVVVIASAMSLMVALLTLAQYLFSVNLRIDEFFVVDSLSATLHAPGRLSPNSLVCTVALAMALLIGENARIVRPARQFIMEALGSLVFALGVTAALGYLSGMPRAYTWGEFTHMPLQSALLFAFLGKTTTISAWLRGIRTGDFASVSLSRPVFLSITAFTLALWQALSSEERVNVQRVAEIAGQASYGDSYLPMVLLLSGLIIAVLGGLMAHLALSAKVREVATTHVNRQLRREIANREKAEAELLKAKDTADAANASKSIFLANISHEIRTPVGAMMGFAELLATPNLQEVQKQQHIETIQRNGNLLLHLIDDILDLSKVEAGKIDLEYLDISLRDLLADTETILGARAKSKGIALTLSSRGPLPCKFRADPTRIRQILFNVIGNAIKFTSVGEVAVEIRCVLPEDNHNELIFTISDTGIGLSDLQKSRLFKPFSQGDTATNRIYGGTGLGLDLSRRLALAMDGDIVLRESAPGKGSVFVISLPCQPAADCRWVENIEKVHHPIEAKEPPAPEQEIKGLRVLLVEDSYDNQVLFNYFLSMAGANVDIAGDGLVATEKANANLYDVVLMDIQMPKQNGYQTTRKLRDDGFKQPIIALTAHAMKEDVQKYFDSGFDDFIRKPVKYAALIAKLAKYHTGDSHFLSISHEN